MRPVRFEDLDDLSEQIADRARRPGRWAMLMPVLLPLTFLLVLVPAELLNAVTGTERLGAQPSGPGVWLLAGTSTAVALVPQAVGLVWARAARRAGARTLGAWGLAVNGGLVVALVGMTVANLVAVRA